MTTSTVQRKGSTILHILACSRRLRVLNEEWRNSSVVNRRKRRSDHASRHCTDIRREARVVRAAAARGTELGARASCRRPNRAPFRSMRVVLATPPLLRYRLRTTQIQYAPAVASITRITLALSFKKQ